jgi:hypothetical protein
MLMKPSDRSFYDPASFAEPTAVHGVAVGKCRLDIATSQLALMRARAVRAVALDFQWAAARSAWLAMNRRNGVNERHQLRDIVIVGGGQCDGQRNAGGVRQHVMLAACLASIGRIRPGFCPPSTARTLELSITARDQSIRSAACNLANSTRCKTSHTPAAYQSRSRRQQVMPHPQFISCGKSSHGMPVRNTNKMPVSAARSPIGGRPPLGYSRGAGSKGSISDHSSSLTNVRAIVVLHDPSQTESQKTTS